MPDVEINLAFFLDITSREGGVVDEIAGLCQMVIVVRGAHMNDLIHGNVIMGEFFLNLFMGIFLNCQDFAEFAVFRPGKFCKDRKDIAFQGNPASGSKEDLTAVDRHLFIKGIIKRIPCTTFQFFDDLFCKCHTSSFLYNKLL